MRNTFYMSHVALVQAPTDDRFFTSPVGGWDCCDICMTCFDALYPALEKVDLDELPKHTFFQGCVNPGFYTPDGALWAVCPDDWQEHMVYCEQHNGWIGECTVDDCMSCPFATA